MARQVKPNAAWPPVWRCRDDEHKLILSCKYMSPGRERLKDAYLTVCAAAGGAFAVPAVFGAGFSIWFIGTFALWLGFVYALFRVSHPWAGLIGKRVRMAVTPEGVLFRGRLYPLAGQPEISLDESPGDVWEMLDAQEEMTRLREAGLLSLRKPYGYGSQQLRIARIYGKRRARQLALRVAQIVAQAGDVRFYGQFQQGPTPFWARGQRPFAWRGEQSETGSASGAHDKEQAADEEDPFADDDEPQSRHRGKMTRAEALDILGLKEGASSKDIMRAYNRLMKKVHPDTGGSNRFAQLLNEAREVLLGTER